MAQSNTTDGGRLVKMEVDYSSNCDEKIPICQALALEGKLNEALEILYSLEKQTRTVRSCWIPPSFDQLIQASDFDLKGSRRYIYGKNPGSYCPNLF